MSNQDPSNSGVEDEQNSHDESQQHNGRRRLMFNPRDNPSMLWFENFIEDDDEDDDEDDVQILVDQLDQPPEHPQHAHVFNGDSPRSPSYDAELIQRIEQRLINVIDNNDINDDVPDEYDVDVDEDENDLELEDDGERNEIVYDTSEANDDNTTDPTGQTNQTNYDISLPIEHSYLGGLDAVESARRLFTPGSVVSLKTLYLNGIFLFPGQEIPLTFHNQITINFITSIIENYDSRTLGIRIGLLEDRFGTTAEIRSFSFKDQDSITVKVQGRQRFLILEDCNNAFGEYEPKVRILPEIDMQDFFRPLIQSEYRLERSKRPFLTSLTAQALNQYDNRFLMEGLKSTLMKIFEARIKNDEFSYPVDAIAFSYFVLMAIPFPDFIKTRLLKIDCVNLRLRLEYSLLSENFKFICGMCCLNLCDRDSFLIMSKLGTSGTFVNSIGIIHELYTFSTVENTRRVSQYSEEFSWFPNYGWIIVNCRHCGSHLGWEFQTKKSNIYPKKFWALTKNSIRLTFQFDENRDESFVYKMFEQDLAGDLSLNNGGAPASGDILRRRRII